MKYFYICAVVVFGFLEFLVCKAGCGNGYLDKSWFLQLDCCGEIFFSVKTVVKWNIWKICSMQNGSSHTFILTFRFAFRERERIFWNSYSQMVSAGFFTCFSLFLAWGGFFLHLFADLPIPLFPQITCLTFYDLKFCPFFQKLESEKEKERKEKGGKISQHKPNKNPTPNQQTENPLTPYPYFLNPTYYPKI